MNKRSFTSQYIQLLGFLISYSELLRDSYLDLKLKECRFTYVNCNYRIDVIKFYGNIEIKILVSNEGYESRSYYLKQSELLDFLNKYLNPIAEGVHI